MKRCLFGLLTLAFAAAPACPQVPAPPASLDLIHEALLLDLSSGATLYAKNADAHFLPASMTKAMSALVAFDLIAEGKLDERTIYTVSPEISQQWAGIGTSLFLRPHEQISVGDLLMGAMTASANDATVVLARGAAGSSQRWVGWMNAAAQRIGMTGSHFGTPNGWPDAGQTFVTARDMAILGRTLVERHPALYRRYIGHPAIDWNGRSRRNHDPFIGVVPGADGIKTGHTNEAGFTYLGTVDRGGRRLMLVIGGAPSGPLRASAARDLVEWGFSAWASHRVVAPGAVIGEAQVQGGALRRVGLTPLRPIALTLPIGTALPTGGIAARIVYTGPLRAPLRQGAPVAELELAVPGLVPQRIPLVATETIAAGGPFDRLVNGLLGLVP